MREHGVLKRLLLIYRKSRRSTRRDRRDQLTESVGAPEAVSHREDEIYTGSPAAEVREANRQKVIESLRRNGFEQDATGNYKNRLIADFRIRFVATRVRLERKRAPDAGGRPWELIDSFFLTQHADSLVSLIEDVDGLRTFINRPPQAG